ncbi:Protease [Flavobacterium sp. 9AF]|uniref:rhomboid family intramembrane serine protease n=1 Tax=Flavobacterium sp. 9AF TaxID=2653142 RepID=UPI0012EF111F|nr:rhomboid family intramembrane serine protease [Flavobacterium sp. 9AF]VXC37572.1 Protease [Flavobacterium sp. 9AF]
MMKMTDMVKHLLIINIIFFLGCYLVPTAFDVLALHYFESDKFRFWQPITHIFVHADIGHIFFNMIVLVLFGSVIEYFLGDKKFVLFYFLCGLGAYVLQMLINYFEFHHSLNILIDNGFDKKEIYQTLNEMKYNTIWNEYLSQSNFNGLVSTFLRSSVGASGAISGLMVAFVVLNPNREMILFPFPIPIKAKYLIGSYFLIDLFLGLQGSSLFGSGKVTLIGHFAHLGGAITGLVMMWYWKKNQFNKNRWDR